MIKFFIVLFLLLNLCFGAEHIILEEKITFNGTGSYINSYQGITIYNNTTNIIVVNLTRPLNIFGE